VRDDGEQERRDAEGNLLHACRLYQMCGVSTAA
jgi:hypothetical protein